MLWNFLALDTHARTFGVYTFSYESLNEQRQRDNTKVLHRHESVCLHTFDEMQCRLHSLNKTNWDCFMLILSCNCVPVTVCCVCVLLPRCLRWWVTKYCSLPALQRILSSSLLVMLFVISISAWAIISDGPMAGLTGLTFYLKRMVCELERPGDIISALNPKCVLLSS